MWCIFSLLSLHFVAAQTHVTQTDLIAHADVTSPTFNALMNCRNIGERYPEVRAEENRRREELIKEINERKKLPSFEIFTAEHDGATKDNSSTYRVIWDSNSDESASTLLEFLKECTGAQSPKILDIDTKENLANSIELRSRIVGKWRAIAEGRFGVNYNLDLLRSRPILPDTVLVVPLKSNDLKRTWPLIESLLSSDSLPEEIIFITGIHDPPEHKHLYAWLSFHQYLLADLLPTFPQNRKSGAYLVSLKWAVHEGYDGAAISRKVAAVNANKSLVFNFDADDYLGPTSLRDRYCFMYLHPDVDFLLTAVTYWNATTVEEDVLQQTLINLTESFEIVRNYRSSFLGNNEEMVLDALTKFDGGALERQFRDSLDGWYYIDQNSPKVSPGSIEGLPLVYNVRDCQTILKQILDREWAEQGGYDVPSELASFEYLHRMCMPDVIESLDSSKSGFVGSCGNGWNVAHSSALINIPASRLYFGEDALLNFVASKYGFNLVCLPDISAGLYNLNLKKSKLNHLDAI